MLSLTDWQLVVGENNFIGSLAVEYEKYNFI